jgi:hypothetical protein
MFIWADKPQQLGQPQLSQYSVYQRVSPHLRFTQAVNGSSLLINRTFPYRMIKRRDGAQVHGKCFHFRSRLNADKLHAAVPDQMIVNPLNDIRPYPIKLLEHKIKSCTLNHLR